MVPTVMAKLTLPLVYYPWVAVLSTMVIIWDRGCILGAKRLILSISVASSRSLMVMLPLGLLSETSLSLVSQVNGERHMNQWSSGSLQTNSVAVPEASVSPTQIGENGLSYCIYVVIATRSLTRRCQVCSSS